MDMEEIVMEVRGLRKVYDGFELKDISFTLPKGYIMGYVGQNGAGKTTTIHSILGLLKREGSICIDGCSFEEDEVIYKEKIGFVRDECYFPSNFIMKDIVRIMKQFYVTFDETIFYEYIRRWKLPEKKKIDSFSKGMKIKLMLSTVLARDTKVLILDEATAGLDPISRDEVLEILQDYIKDGDRSVFFSTHLMEDLEKIADYIFFIHNGQQVFFDTKDALIMDYVLVKGGFEDAGHESLKKAVHIQKSKVSFEALIKKSDLDQTKHSFLVEKVSVDDVVTHYMKKLNEDPMYC